ncbi:hypothetical protein CEXT_123071 [Caerostris extrusa]|uniref:Uncharacterized protein n=1 Tax=Caerostris extrusa TaxID=172846 RepID=A0AAV4SYZ9_CAEEX|nr:hypothetical protein CEXT_123071 [Caerostris extrusa]
MKQAWTVKPLKIRQRKSIPSSKCTVVALRPSPSTEIFPPLFYFACSDWCRAGPRAMFGSQGRLLKHGLRARLLASIQCMHT